MKAGLHFDMPMEDYLSLPAAGSSTLATLDSQSAYHAWYGSFLNPSRIRDNSSETDNGTIAHALLLEGSEDNLEVIDAPDWRTKAAKESRDAAYAAGKTPILAGKIQPIRDMVESVRRWVDQSEVKGIFQNGNAEVTGLWEENGAQFRLRADWLTTDQSIILDLKTTATNANPQVFIRQLLSMNYDIQAALYCRGMEKITGKRPKFIFLVAENKPPYACSLIGLAPSLLELADRKVDRAIAQWSECIKSRKFPAYPMRICWAEAPAWELAKFDERDILNQETGLIPGTGTYSIEFDAKQI